MRKLFYIFLFAVALAITSFGQAKPITEAEYEPPEAAPTVSRRM